MLANNGRLQKMQEELRILHSDHHDGLQRYLVGDEMGVFRLDDGKKEAHYAGRYSMALFSTAIWIGQRRELFLIFLLFHFSHLEERVLASQHLLTSIINGGDARCPRRRRSSEEQKFFPTKNIASGQMLEIIFCM